MADQAQTVAHSGKLDIPAGCAAAIDLQIKLQQIMPPAEGMDRDAQRGQTLSPDIVASPVKTVRQHAKGANVAGEKLQNGRQPLYSIDDLHLVRQVARMFTIPVGAVEPYQALVIAERAAQESLDERDLLRL